MPSSPSSNDSSSYNYVFFHLICPSLGSILATAMFAAPIHDLREALRRQSLASLNPRPWAIMTGNCLGWIAYGYYVQNPFILMSNLPGLILSVWLNTSACQLEYHTTTVAHNHHCQQQQRRRYPAAHHPSRPNYDVLNFDNTKRHTNYDQVHRPLEDDDITDVGGGDGGDPNILQSPSPILTQQQMWWLWVWIVWALILSWVGWISPWQKNQGQEALVVGWAVNLNLIFFYGAPLQSIQHVMRTKSSESIHTGTMMMGIGNATFWFLYGIALWDYVVMLPNGIGLLLAIAQLVVCCWYPRQEDATAVQHSGDISMTSVVVNNKNNKGTGIFSNLTLNEASSNDPKEEETLGVGGGVMG